MGAQDRANATDAIAGKAMGPRIEDEVQEVQRGTAQMTLSNEMSFRSLAKKGWGISRPAVSQMPADQRRLPEVLKGRIWALGAFRLLIGDRRPENIFFTRGNRKATR